MSIFVLPALLALALKIYILVVAHAARSSRVFCGMVLVFAAHNFIEVVAYFQYSGGTLSETLFRVYYAATFCMLCYMCLYAIEVSKLKQLKKLLIPIVSWMTLASILVLFSNTLVSGVEPIGYAVTAIRGSNYWLFSATTLIALVFVAASLVTGYQKSASHHTKVQCLYNLFALAPIVVLGFVIIPLMYSGYQVNAAGFLPLCTSLFLLITLQSESRHHFTDIRRFLPNSLERKTSLEIQQLISRFSMDQISYKEMSQEIEKIALQHKMEEAGQSVSQAARLLKMKRSTLYSMLDRHGIKRDSS